MTQWDLEETRQHVTRLFGRPQMELANPCIRSCNDRQAYARIHLQDAKAKIDSYLQAELHEASLMDVTLFGNQDSWAKFNVFTREIGASLTACIQSMHALPDILSNAIYYSLGLNLREHPLSLRNVTAPAVAKVLQCTPLFLGLSSLLRGFTTDGTFPHLSALANQAKHRSIVFPAVNEDWTGERSERHIVTFPAFSYEEVPYRQVFAEDFLKGEYERCSRLIVHSGCALNEALRSYEP